VIVVRRPVPLWLGDRPSFYRPRRGRFTGVPHYFPTCRGMASSAVELTTVLANHALVEASWRVLCLYRSDFEGRSVVVDRPVFVCGQTRGGPLTEARTRYSVRYGGVPLPCAPIVPESLQQCARVALQGRGWPHRVDSDGDDHSRRPDVMA
jgi:hypothetical protein